MADLNVEHMGGTGSTDVLSFPLDDGDEFSIDLPGVQLHLGDIVLCPEVAERQAPLHSGTTEHEITLLLVHGVLHILGHDHAEPDETSRMRERERVNIERYGVVHPSL
ncbi:UNVERIFIED_CONTAM: hypothetical protein GTU68_063311 [Idotea baltica]|nr:hypothetical protein [Idotea baltica]